MNYLAPETLVGGRGENMAEKESEWVIPKFPLPPLPMPRSLYEMLFPEESASAPTTEPTTKPTSAGQAIETETEKIIKTSIGEVHLPKRKDGSTEQVGILKLY
jgi:hypothetical protein